jgi:hypothetical protein
MEHHAQKPSCSLEVRKNVGSVILVTVTSVYSTNTSLTLTPAQNARTFTFGFLSTISAIRSVIISTIVVITVFLRFQAHNAVMSSVEHVVMPYLTVRVAIELATLHVLSVILAAYFCLTLKIVP